jgi:hypothetical protein
LQSRDVEGADLSVQIGRWKADFIVLRGQGQRRQHKNGKNSAKVSEKMLLRHKTFTLNVPRRFRCLD